MSSQSRLLRAAFGSSRNYGDTPARSARAKATITRTRPWERGRIGRIEAHISRAWAFADKLYTTGELARLIYANPLYDQNYQPRGEDNPPPKIKSWHYLAIRKAAPTFADRVGRSSGRGRAWVWRIRPDQYLV